MSTEAFSQTVHSLYAAATNVDLWPDALRSLVDLTGGAGIIVDFVSKDPAVPSFCLSGNFPEDKCAEFAEYYMPICKRVAAAIDQPGTSVFYDNMIMSEAEMDRDPVYAWLGTMGLRYYVGGRLGETERFHNSFSVQRSKRQGHADSEHLRAFEFIKPHMAQALHLSEALQTLSGKWKFGLDALEQFPQAVIGISQFGRIVFANPRAEKLLAAGDGLFSSIGHLATSARNQQEGLEALIKAAIARQPLEAAGWIRINRPSGLPPLAVLVSPLCEAPHMLSPGAPAVLVTIADPSRPLPVDISALKRIYGLTETEARVAVAMASGHSISSAAMACNMARETLRTHLKQLFRKTGVNRQQDLVRLLSAFHADE
jgi:DNA-binding CsgD family transcriptional regulator